MQDHWRPDPGRAIEESEVDLAPLADLRVAVIGFGTMGRAQALNLRDSGIDVVVGLRQGSPRRHEARAAGLPVMTVGEAAAAAQVVSLLLPDEAMGAVYAREVAPQLRRDAALGFAHGFAVAFGQIDPGDRACFLVAPKSQGDKLRESYLAGGGAPGLLAVHDSSPPGTWALCAAYARAIGCLRGGGWVASFEAECVADQFGEQVVLCGGVVELLQAAFETLVDRGHDPTNAYFECVHELKLITDLIHRYGVDGMRARISPTAAYGGLTRGPRLIDRSVRARMATILDEIEDGRFAQEFLARHDDRERGREALAARESSSPLAGTGRELQPRLQALDGDATAPSPEER